MRRSKNLLVMGSVAGVLAVCGLLLGVYAASASGSSGPTDTGTGTTATTAVTTSSGSPAPYLRCTDYSSPQQPLSRSRVRSFTIIIGCFGDAQSGYTQVTKLPKGWSFIPKGSIEYMATGNRVGKVHYWQRRSFKMVNGRPTWYMNDLTPWRYHKRMAWVVRVHIALSRHAKLGNNPFVITQFVQSGAVSQTYPNQVSYYIISK